MNKYRFLLVTIIFIAALIVATPALIGALPDRYVLRLPDPLQKYGLPENKVSLLPTADAPAAAVSLLINASGTVQPEATSAAAAVTQTVKDLAGVRKTDSVASMSASPETSDQTQESMPTTTPTSAPTPTPEPTPTPWPLPEQVRLDGISHKFQTWNNCGPATLAMGLTYFGVQVSQEQTAAFLKPNPEDRNVSPQEMARYVNEQTPYQALFRANGTVASLKRLLANGIPVIVETGIDPPGEFRWLGWYGHYLLVVAYSDDEEQFWVYDSWFGTSEEPLQNAHPDGRIIKYEDLAADWSQFNRNYIALFRPEQEALLQELVGREVDDGVMWTGALDQAKKDIEGEPDNPFYWFNLGTGYVAMEQYTEAAIAFDQARAIGLPWRMLWYQFGPYEAYLNAGRYDDVVVLADATLEGRPYFEESYYYKGLAQERLGEKDDALHNLEQAAEFNPNFTPAQAALDRLK